MTSIQIDINDGLSSSTAIKGPCRVATTANITLSGEQTIDGVAVVTDDRVLVKDQTTASENGIYVADTGPWRRSKDFNKTRDVKTGTMVNVTSGTVGAGWWQVTTADPISIGTTSITFAIVFGAVPSVIRDYLDTAPYVPTRTVLKALDTTKDTVAILTESGRQGVFIWTAGDFAARIAADAGEGVYVKADAIAATVGAWVRQFSGPLVATWFGLASGGAEATNVTAMNNLLALAITADTSILIPKGDYGFNAKITASTAYFLEVKCEYGGVSNLVWSNATGGIDLTHTDANRPPTIQGLRFLTTAAGGGTALKITAPDSPSLVRVGARLFDVYAHASDPAADYWNNGIVLVNCWYPQIVRPDIKGKNDVITGAMVNGIQLTDCQAPQVRDVCIFHCTTAIQADGAIHGEGVDICGGEIVGVLNGIMWQPSVFKGGITIHDMHINASARCIRMDNSGQLTLHDLSLYKTHINQTDWEAIELNNCHGMEVHSIFMANPSVTVGANDGIVLNGGCSNIHIHDISGEAWNGAGALVLLTTGATENKIYNIIVGRNATSLVPVAFLGSPSLDNMFWNIDDLSRRALTANSATPSVGNSINGLYATANSSPTAYTNFTDGYDGQVISVLVTDANSSFNHVAALILQDSANVTPPNGGVMKFRYEATGTLWREIHRNFVGNTLIVGSYTRPAQSKLHSYNSANSLQIGARIENDNGGSPIAALGFQATSTASAETRSSKAGLGFLRQAANGRGRLGVYVRTTSDGNDFDSADLRGAWNQSGIFNSFKGADVASAAAIVPTGNLFHVTGTTTITSITATLIEAGTIITIIFDGILTFTDGSNLKLAGNFVTSADDTITLRWDGTNWYELCRSVN